MSTIGVTGARGFIGRHLCDYLESCGHAVLRLSRNHCDGCMTLEDYRDCPHVDWLYHLAEEPDRWITNQKDQHSLSKSRLLVDALASRFKERFIYISSTVVYGDQTTTPHRETDAPVISDAYTDIKIHNENTTLSYRGSVARLSNVFGSGLSSSTVIAQLIDKIKNEKVIALKDPNPIRDFIFIDDVIRALHLFTQIYAPGIINIGSGDAISIEQLATSLLHLCSDKSHTLTFEQQNPRLSCIYIDITKAETLLGWQPAVPLRQRLKQMLIAMGVSCDGHQ